MTTTEILTRIEDDVYDEAIMSFSEICPPNSLEWDIEVDNYVDKQLCKFHSDLHQSITKEMFNV